MDPSKVLDLLLKLNELRKQIVGQKEKCLQLIDRCLSLQPSLQSLGSQGSPLHLQKLEELLQKCLDVCQKFCGHGWVRTAFEVILKPTLFDELHQDLTTLSGDLNLEIAICQRNTQIELMEMVSSLKQFVEVVGPETLKSNDLKGLMRSSLELSEMASVDVNRATMKMETLNLDLLNWKKEPDSELGRGGFGIVYKGKYGKDHAAVAVKVLISVDEKEKLKLTREVRVMGKANHPNVIKLFGYSIERGLIVMEMANRTLSDVIADEENILQMRDVLTCFIDVLSGLRYLHYHDILHRDLKPQNILLVVENIHSKNGGKVVAKISDFGLATMSSLSASTTRNGPIGSVAYLAPELYEDKPLYSIKSDMYGVGITFNEVLTRQQPFSGLPMNLIIGQVVKGNRPASDWHASYPKDNELIALIGDQETGCLHQDPKMRPTSDELLKVLKPKFHSLSSIAPQNTNVIDDVLDQVIFHSVENLGLHSSVCLENLAASGFSPAQNSLGVSLIKEFEYVQAFEYFRLAAEQKYHPAEFNLGCCYEEGKGTDVNKEAALPYFSRSAEASFPPALYKLGLIEELNGDRERALNHYRAGADLKHAPCQFKFGFLHEMIEDFDTASKYYLMSAEQNYSPAQHHLALLYLHGRASPPQHSSPNEAATSLLLSSAQRNYPPSHFILAFELKHEPSFHFEKAANLKYEPALAKLGRTRNGSLWTERDCVEINQPDFPYVVPAEVSPIPPPSPEGETSIGYMLIPASVSGPSESSPPDLIIIQIAQKVTRVAQREFYYWHHLVACCLLCSVSTILLALSLSEKWGEGRLVSLDQRRLFSAVGLTFEQPTRPVRRSLRSLSRDRKTTISVSTQKSSSISWPTYLTVPGESVLTLCGGHTLDVSMCPISSDSNIACSGDPFFELLNEAGTSVISSNNNYCGLCPSLLYTIPTSNSCNNYILRASCVASTSCKGKTLLSVTTSSCSETFSGSLSTTTNSYSVLSCSLLWRYKDSLSNIEGQWTKLNGGSVSDQCQLQGSGYVGTSYLSNWSSTTSESRFYFCANEQGEDQFDVSTFAGNHTGTSNGIGTNAMFTFPSGIALSSDDSYALVAGPTNHIIRKIVISTAVVSVVAGGGLYEGGPNTQGSTNGIGSNALFNGPSGLTLSSNDSFVLVADANNNMIRQIYLSTSVVSIVAGRGRYYPGWGNGIGTNAMFDSPQGLTLSSKNNYALVADSANSLIRKVDLATAAVSLFAGRYSGSSNGIGSQAAFNRLGGITLSSDDSYALVADTYNNMIRKIVMSTSAVYYFAGSQIGNSGFSDGIGSNALFRYPSRVTFSSNESYALVADTYNNMIRKIVISTSEVSLVAGGGGDGRYGAINGIGTNAFFVVPIAISLSLNDSYALVTDSSTHLIRKMTISPISVVNAPMSSQTIQILRPEMTSVSVQCSLVFIIFAFVLVAFRFRDGIRTSLGHPRMKMFEDWWWAGYLLCCTISAICAILAVMSYSEEISEQSQGHTLMGFDLCFASIVISFGALLCSPEFLVWLLALVCCCDLDDL